jgi:hypothetical protein
MSTLGSEMAGRSQQPYVEWPERYRRYAERERYETGRSLVVPGLVLLGLGALVWWWVGPDIRRYMKIRSM